MSSRRRNKSKSRDVTIYGKQDYQRDEKSFNESMNGQKPIDWSCFSRLMIHDLCNNGVPETLHIGKYSLEDIKRAIEMPHRHGKVLMGASNYLMHISPHYYRLNTFYSNISTFCWWLDIYDVKDNVNLPFLIKTYDSLASKLENMNIQHEFSKIMDVLPYQDVFCGLVVESSTDFFIQKLDFRICKLKKIQDGLYNFAINLSGINPLNIDAYPDYVQKEYVDYKEGKLDSCWYIPPSDKQICIKLNSQWVHPMPLLINLVQDIFDLNIYKKLKLQSARTDNYKGIAVKVPIDEKSIDKPLLSPDTLGIFAEINKESLSNDIGMIHTLGSDAQAISFKNSSNVRNNVADATDEVYDASGITKELFNGSSSGTAVTFSVENDSGVIYKVYRQFERWVNRYIKLNKYNKPTFKFSFGLLDATTLNKDKVIDRYKAACTLGVSVKGQYLALLGMTPSRTKGAFILEKSIFDFQNNFIPLSTSYTQSNTDSAGRPTNESQNEPLSENGEITKDSESNSKR